LRKYPKTLVTQRNRTKYPFKTKTMTKEQFEKAQQIKGEIVFYESRIREINLLKQNFNPQYVFFSEAEMNRAFNSFIKRYTALFYWQKERSAQRKLRKLKEDFKNL